MTKENQKILYEHYKAVAENKKKDKGKDYKPIIRENCKRYAKEILKSFPEFEQKEELNSARKEAGQKPITKTKSTGDK